MKLIRVILSIVWAPGIAKSCCMALEFSSLNTLRLLPGGEEGDLGFPIELEFTKKALYERVNSA